VNADALKVKDDAAKALVAAMQTKAKTSFPKLSLEGSFSA
jgi:hypothetical protein